ncbi:MAG: xanthine dehydrogenase family protein molybdopterin-binding subunit [Alphaproteobacteria bacterium]|nr:xanthine dehydrogenase family protein molybdopterin-binding subunit [Alphaproteobacteria bacterium]
MQFGIGQPAARVEDVRLLTGGGRYTADIDLPGQAHAVVVRSPHAHARLLGVDTGAARTVPGVLAVLSSAELAADALGDIPCRALVKNRDGTPCALAPRSLLARERVRHVGDPIAFVVAETLAAARDAAELVEVNYAPLPAVVEADRAIAPGAPGLWDHAPGNLCFDWAAGDEQATEAAFAKAAKIVRLELINNRLVVCALEPRAAIGDFDPSSDRSTLITASQGTSGLQGVFADTVLKIGRDKLRVITPDVGGGFGMKAFPHPEQGLVLWAARRLGRPVKWVGERSEGFQGDWQGRDNITVGELGLDGAGKFLALRVDTLANLGAYLSSFAPYVPTHAGGTMTTGLYAIPAAFTRVRGVFTNTLPVDAYRGAGRPEAAYLIERLVDQAARAIGAAPDELRRLNLIERLPYRTAFGDTYDSGDFRAVMDKALARADWAGFPKRRTESLARGRRRGIGLATYVERSGGASDTVKVQFNVDDTVSVLMGNQSNGQGHATLYTQMFAARLGIDGGRIRIVQGDSDLTPAGFTGGSRATTVGGPAVDGAAKAVIERGRALAARMFQAAATDIAYAEGAFSVAGSERAIDLFALARATRETPNLAAADERLDLSHSHAAPGPTYPNGCHVCELEVDPATGRIEILRFTVVDDFGAVINPLTLAGQVHGGIAQGLGQALTERTVYDPDSGQLMSASFMDYALPRATDLPAFDFAMHNTPSANNPLGLKGAGEAGAVGAPPAMMNALADALSPLGVTRVDMPATPERVWNSIEAARTSGAA